MEQTLSIYLRGQNRSITSMNDIPSIQPSIHSTQIKARTTNRVPTAVNQLRNVFFGPKYRRVFQLFAPNLSLPIANWQEELQERWVALNMGNGAMVTLNLSVDSVSGCLESLVANEDDTSLCTDHVFIWDCAFVFECIDLKFNIKWKTFFKVKNSSQTPKALSSFFIPSMMDFGLRSSVSIGASRFLKSHQKISPAADPEKNSMLVLEQ